MHQEILQTPQAVANLATVLKRRPAWIRALKQPPPLVVLVARGSSDHGAIFGRYFLEAALNVPVVNAAPSLQTLLREKPQLPRGTLVIGISQSGESTDVVACFEHLRQPGVHTLAITNTPGSSLALSAQEVMDLEGGPECSVAATKTYSLTLAAIYGLTCWLKGLNPAEALAQAAADMARGLQKKDDLTQHARRYSYALQAAVLGRLFHYASAKELALKLMETCGMAAMGASEADFQHGPIRLLNRGYPAFVFATDGPTEASTQALLEKAGPTGSGLFLWTDHRPWLKGGREGFYVKRAAPPALGPLVMTPCWQWFTASLALEKGLNPDAPPHLNKITRTT